MSSNLFLFLGVLGYMVIIFSLIIFLSGKFTDYNAYGFLCSRYHAHRSVVVDFCSFLCPALKFDYIGYHLSLVCSLTCYSALYLVSYLLLQHILKLNYRTSSKLFISQFLFLSLQFGKALQIHHHGYLDR